MDGHGIIVTLLIGLIAGFLTGKIMKGSGFGVIGDIVIGILGALVGGFIAGHLGFMPAGIVSTIIVATLGAILLTFLYRLVTGSRG
ncbi:GlsB/YeaQ/YmgE family stress response membrane protein [Granulicella sp. 5B5]|uniref:GlsB/YeaQ/YmgE family stress response membrane protein n=1 Tax=Granulicella sp. 5B5 TaxID=1617967 RepID=UPI0015F6C961|nr:GlsB/YeaQ/YmgE family stress response membrane protein [Granulicella sp. 5B5]QMV18421.1 GlsB/YeaQ/YmgE family stress response membrane protein [Granulicella sp. 5B5]